MFGYLRSFRPLDQDPSLWIETLSGFARITATDYLSLCSFLLLIPYLFSCLSRVPFILNSHYHFDCIDLSFFITSEERIAFTLYGNQSMLSHIWLRKFYV